MGRGVRYRITTPTVAVVQESGGSVTQMLPAGAIIVVDHAVVLTGNALISATWEERTISIFAQDVRNRAERVSGADR